MFLVCSLTLSAQTGQGFIMGETHEFDLKEFIDNLDWESADVQSRIDTRRAGNAPAPDSIRWIDRIYNLPDYMRAFYDNHGKRVKEVLNGRSNYLSDPSKDKKYAMQFGDGSTFVVLKDVQVGLTYDYPQDVVDQDATTLRGFAITALNEHLEQHRDEYLADVYDFIPYMFMSMSYDYPEAFWLRNYWSWATTCSYSYGYLPDSGKDSINYDFMVLFAIKMGEFDYRIEDYRDPAVLTEAVQEYKGLVQNILADAPTTSRFDQVRYLNDWLTKHNAYNTNYDPQNSPSIVWSPMSALQCTDDERGPVCEGYARAFKVLCDGLDIPCILAVGDASGSRSSTPESHMWNEVKMNDGYWYAVDVTWNDPNPGGPKESGNENEDWLLLGKYDIVNEWDNLTFAESHPNSLVYGQAQSAAWDFDNSTLIADYKFDPATGIAQVRPAQNDNVYSILGVKLNKTPADLEPGIYIINGRKVVIK